MRIALSPRDGQDVVLDGRWLTRPPQGIREIADTAGYVILDRSFADFPAGRCLAISCEIDVWNAETKELLHRRRRALLPGVWVIEARGGGNG
jgi:hypothetical protein